MIVVYILYRYSHTYLVNPAVISYPYFPTTMSEKVVNKLGENTSIRLYSQIQANIQLV